MSRLTSISNSGGAGLPARGERAIDLPPQDVTGPVHVVGRPRRWCSVGPLRAKASPIPDDEVIDSAAACAMMLRTGNVAEARHEGRGLPLVGRGHALAGLPVQLRGPAGDLLRLRPAQGADGP